MKMSLIALSLVLTGLTANAKSCFVPEKTVYTKLPQVICVDSVALIDETSTAVVLSTDSVPTTASEGKIQSLSRHNEEVLNFATSVSLIESYDAGCFAGESVQVVLKGSSRSSHSPAVDTSALNVSVVYTATNDTCHSEPSTEVFQYKLVK